ncbi:hypothetical protein BJ165DRAFT_1333434, partial [Panaeolus papilionaceus]
KFPEMGVGQNWTERFLIRHRDLLKMSKSVPLESKRGKAVNETANECYWKLLKDTLEEYDIKPHNIYSADECSILERGSEKEIVIAPQAQKGPVYQQKAGGR